MMDCNLLGLKIIVLFLNQLIATSDARFKFEINFSKLFKFEDMVLLSAKLWMSAFLTDKNKSLMTILKKIRPRMEPSGTPDNKIWKRPSVLFILTFCWRLWAKRYKDIFTTTIRMYFRYEDVIWDAVKCFREVHQDSFYKLCIV